MPEEYPCPGEGCPASYYPAAAENLGRCSECGTVIHPCPDCGVVVGVIDTLDNGCPACASTDAEVVA